MKKGFTDVKTFSDGALFAEEIAVLQEILWKILNRFRYYPEYGTIILEGQQKGEDEKCMVMVLAKMRPKDILLQRSAKSLMHKADDLEQWMRSVVDGEFETCDLLELMKWKKWYGEAEADGNLDFYFQ